MIKDLYIFLFCIASLGFTYDVHSQGAVQETTPPDYIKTVQLFGENDFSETPVIPLGSPIKLNFDDINGDEADYYYKITHYNFDWTPSILSKNEYLNGFDDIRIINYENSFNALQLYSNYTLTIPNEDTQGIRVSGNYLLEIYNDDDELVFSRKFIVYKPLVNVKVYIKRSRDLAFINSKQSVQFEIKSPNKILRNPQRTVKTLVVQNNDFNHAITNLIPQYTIANDLIYRYDQEASFWGGNEFLFFDNKEIRSSTVNINHVQLKDIYHNYLYTDITRANRKYTYAPDINGRFQIRNLRAEDNNIEADYAWMHFTLECYENLGDKEIHLYGAFNNYVIDDSTRLNYNKDKGIFELSYLFKQGFYNYRYVVYDPATGSISPNIVSGDFDETENEYTVIVYYRTPGGRYDEVIGKGVTSSRIITN
ncbi:type IX secretion system plug protein [Aquimarina rhabdastrellae]